MQHTKSQPESHETTYKPYLDIFPCKAESKYAGIKGYKYKDWKQ